MTSQTVSFVFCSLAAATVIFGSISYAMTAKTLRVRFWGHRIAASLLYSGGAVALGLSILKPELVGRSGFFWAAAMFMLAGWMTTPTRKFKNTYTAEDPLAALSRLPRRLDP